MKARTVAVLITLHTDAAVKDIKDKLNWHFNTPRGSSSDVEQITVDVPGKKSAKKRKR